MKGYRFYNTKIGRIDCWVYEPTERRTDELEGTIQRPSNRKLTSRLAYGVKGTTRMPVTRRRFCPAATYVRAAVSTGERAAPFGEKAARTSNLARMNAHRVESIRIGTNRSGSDWLQLQQARATSASSPSPAGWLPSGSHLRLAR